MANRSINSSKSKGETFENYFKTSNGKKALKRAKEAALAGFNTLADYDKSKTPAVAEGTPVELFETTSSIVAGPALPFAAIVELYDELKSMVQPTTVSEQSNKSTIVETQGITEVSGKIDTFVEKGDVTEQSILDQLNDIHTCI